MLHHNTGESVILDCKVGAIIGGLGALGPLPEKSAKSISRFSHAKVFGGEISFIVVWQAVGIV